MCAWSRRPCRRSTNSRTAREPSRTCVNTIPHDHRSSSPGELEEAQVADEDVAVTVEKWEGVGRGGSQEGGQGTRSGGEGGGGGGADVRGGGRGGGQMCAHGPAAIAIAGMGAEQCQRETCKLPLEHRGVAPELAVLHSVHLQPHLDNVSHTQRSPIPSRSASRMHGEYDLIPATGSCRA